MRPRIVRWVGVVALAAGATSASAQVLHDHLECFKMSDRLALKGVVDVDASPVASALGCKVRRAGYFCAPASKTVVSTNVVPQPVAGRDLSDDRICYKLNCPKPYPGDHGVNDQFGFHAASHLVPRLLCTPAVKGPPLPTVDGLDDIACYKIRDPLAFRARVVLDSPQFGATSGGCDVARGKLLCVPAVTTIREINVSPILNIGGTTRDDEHVCYPLKCSNPPSPGPQVVSDRFGTRTVTRLGMKLMCTPAMPAVTTTTSTTTTGPTTSTTTTTLPPGTDAALVCQRTLEAGGMAYANQMMDAIQDCAASHAYATISGCLVSAPVQSRLQTVLTQWRADAGPPCGLINLRTDLGYAERCGVAPSGCTSPVSTSDDLVSCLSCRINESLRGMAASLYADRPTSTQYPACSGTLGDGSLGLARTALQGVHQCAQQSGLISVAACFSSGAATWRAQAESACAAVNPFSQLSYPQMCSNRLPVFPNSYVFSDPPCTIPVVGKSDPAPDNDLYDCLTCRAEEAVLQVARDVHGTNLCCIGGTCNKVLTRFACREAGGTPVRYRIDSLPVSVSGPHGLDIAPDGSLLIADSGTSRALRVALPSNTVTDLGSTSPLNFPVGIAGDAAGNVYVVNRCSQTVVRIAPGGARSVYAGTGTAGHSGDEGPATLAQIVAPDGVQVDAAGNVYFTESGALNFVCGGFSGAGERLRMVDTNGVIHTLAGSGVGTGGEGGPALAAQLSIPYGLRLGSNGSILIGEAGGERVLRVAGGILTRVAGLPRNPQGSHSGYGGAATLARFYENCGVAEDADGNVIIGPMENNRVALVDTLGSVIGIGGTGEISSGTAGDGGPAMFATIGLPEDLVVGQDGRIYVSDLAVSRIRVLTREPY